jgi:hypothetical protein
VLDSLTIFAIFDPDEEEGSSSADTTSINILCCEVASELSISVSNNLFFSKNLLFSSSAMEVVSEEEFVRLGMLWENDWSAVEEGRTASNGFHACTSVDSHLTVVNSTA